MNSEEIEFQVKKRRSVALLYVQISKFLHSAKEFSILSNSIFKEQKQRHSIITRKI